MLRAPLTVALSLIVACSLLAVPARADDVGTLLKKGPLVRLETDAAGKLKGATCIVDVDAPIEIVWAVLTDYERYIDFMPRMTKLDVRRDGADAYLAIKLDTPLVATNYTNKMTANATDFTIAAKQVEGDLDGSAYFWRLTPTASGTRITYSGIIRNYSGIAERFEDEQQTITIGINVVSLLQAAKAVKFRAEGIQKKPAVAGIPAASPR
jgi:carbon monoxide dehydrogenase subunit G